jgi:hypothetical protein
MAKGVKTGGRTKGTPNRITSDIRKMVLEALDNKGGVEYLERQAEENPTSFMTLVGKCLPKDVKVEADGELTVTIKNYSLADNITE